VSFIQPLSMNSPGTVIQTGNSVSSASLRIDAHKTTESASAKAESRPKEREPDLCSNLVPLIYTAIVATDDSLDRRSKLGVQWHGGEVPLDSPPSCWETRFVVLSYPPPFPHQFVADD